MIVNDRDVVPACAPNAPLLDFLRNELCLTAAKPGCGSGDCGSCLILAGEMREGDTMPRYRTINSCIATVGQLAHAHVITPEGLNGEHLTVVQQALVAEGAVQCGYCTPGLTIALTAALLNGDSLPDALAGNLCRCTGYAGIRRAGAVLSARFPVARLSLAEAEHAGLLPAALVAAAQRLPVLPAPPFIARGPVMAGASDWAVQHPHRAPDRQPVVQLHHIPALRHIHVDEHRIELGAAVTIDELLHIPALLGDWPPLPDVVAHFASPSIRHLATLGGNIANASPVADLAVLLLALDASLVIKGEAGERTQALSTFYTGYHRTALAHDELITRIHIPRNTNGARLHVEKVAKREHDDIASVNSAFCVLPGPAGRFGQIRFSAGGVAPCPLLLSRTADVLVGKPLHADSVRTALQVLPTEISPIDDSRGSARYKQQLLQHLLVAHVTTLFPEIGFKECLA